MLHDLVALYDVLEAEGAPLDRPGWVTRAVDIVLAIDADGQVISATHTKQRKEARRTSVPIWPNRGGSTIRSGFAADAGEYMLKLGGAAYVAASLDHHREMLAGIDDPAAKALLRFIETGGGVWGHLDRDDIKGAKTVGLEFEGRWIHEAPAIRDAWDRAWAARTAGGERSVCTLTGGNDVIETDHPKVMLPASARFISHKYAVATSWREHTGGPVAGVGAVATHKYRAAIEHLVRAGQSAQIGDDVVVYWSTGPKRREAAAVLAALFDGDGQGDADRTDRETETRDIRAAIDALIEGGGPASIETTGRYHVLTIAPGTGRHAIVSYVTGTLAQLVEAAERFAAAHDVPGARFVGVRRLLAAASPNPAKPDTPVPNTRRQLLQFALGGPLYPAELFHRVLQRIRAQGEVSPIRCAALQGYVISKGFIMQDDISHRLGRALSQLDALQHGAVGRNSSPPSGRLLNIAMDRPAQAYWQIAKDSSLYAKVTRGQRGGTEHPAAAALAETLAGIDVDALAATPVYGADGDRHRARVAHGMYVERQERFARIKAAKAAGEAVDEEEDDTEQAA